MESKAKQINGLWLGAALMGLTVLLILTHWPQDKLPIDINLNRFGLDKIVHMTAYGCLAWLFFKTVAPRRYYLGWCGVICGLSLLAVLDEITQPWVNRQFSYFDIVADLIGIAGCFLILYLSKKNSVRKLNPIETSPGLLG